MTIHLLVLQDNTPLGYVLAEEGFFGCDYAWNADYTAYRCLPHRWMPGSDSSYADWQKGIEEDVA
jgi:hypothetical protein